MLRVAVGSKNPVKVGAVQAAFEAYWPELGCEIKAVDVSSGVSAQPMTDKESLQGARNRARRALDAFPAAAYGVGIEGGLQQIDTVWMDTQWVVVVNRAGKSAIGQSVRIEVPDRMVALIQQGLEMGDVIDTVFGQTNMKQAGGYIKEVTQGLINREQLCYGAVVSALAPFATPDLF